MAASYTISMDGTVKDFADPEALLRDIDTLLSYSLNRFVAAVPKKPEDVFKRINTLFKKYNLELVLSVDSDPEAIDYVIHALAGAVLVAPVGGAIGFVTGLMAQLGV